MKLVLLALLVLAAVVGAETQTLRLSSGPTAVIRPTCGGPASIRSGTCPTPQ